MAVICEHFGAPQAISASLRFSHGLKSISDVSRGPGELRDCTVCRHDGR